MDWVAWFREVVFGIALPLFYDLLVALIIIFVGVIVGRIVGKIAERIFVHMSADALMRRAIGVPLPLESYGGRMISYMISLWFLAAALSAFGITIRAAFGVVTVVLVVGILALMLRLDDFVKNVLASYRLYRLGVVKQGAMVDIYGAKAKIQSVGISTIVVQTAAGDRLYVPLIFVQKVLRAQGKIQ